MKKITAVLLSLVMVLLLASCAGKPENPATSDPSGKAVESSDTKTYKIGLCNYVDDASLNQIVDAVKTRLAELEGQYNVKFDIDYENCNADSNVLSQIITDYVANKVDLMVGVATPVAMAMQAATDENNIPVVFSAVSNPDTVQLVESFEAPGANVTGTSDHLNTKGIFDLMFAADKDIKSVGLLYDVGQDSSTVSIKEAKEYLEAKGVAYKEYTGTTVDEIILAAEALVADKVDAVFTPTDNTVMTAELSIYETLANAKIPHYTGADSFALNGAFLGYGVNYVELGTKTADMICDILVNGKQPATLPVVTFENNKVTLNTDICEKLGFDFEQLKTLFAPLCSSVNGIRTAEEFE